MNNNPNNYRPDIDGLRAIAVLAVVIFHAFPSHLPGGFIGVDIFFVISGYLITQIILKRLELGEFSYADFYSRRIRRIFPALSIVLVACFALGWFVLLADEFKQISKHMVAGALSGSNLVLWSESGYFDNTSITKPLLHLWSLGVEEQFYLIWPALLYTLWKFKRGMLPVAILIAIASFSISAYQSYQSPVAAFYSPVSRLWELMIGALLAIAASEGIKLSSRLAANSASCVGAIMILLGLIFSMEGMPFPGWLALLPMGSALIVAGGRDAFVNRALSIRPLVFVGLISFPLYLWHWPLLAFARIIRGEPHTFGLGIALVLLAFILAWVTYVIIEKRARSGRNNKAKVIALSVSMAAIAVIGGLSCVKDGLTSPYIAKKTDRLTKAKADWDYRPTEMQDGRITGLHEFSGTKKDAVLFIGDSLIGQYFPRVRYLYEEAHSKPTNSTTYASRNHCVPMPNTKRMSVDVDCDDYYRAAINLARAPQYKKVVLGGSWQSAVDYFRTESREVMIRDLKRLVAEGKQIYFISMPPHSPKFDPAAMAKTYRNPFKASAASGDASLPRESVEQADQLSSSLLREMALASGAVVINPYDYLCPNGACPVAIDGEATHTDAYHLSATAARKLAIFIDAIVGQSP